ncbi:ATP-binding cassette domain-containing protein [Paenibacillus sp. BR2-3]|uniref:ABC transporter ATP-binding protein n=1 Tax=Paenibacillus sp. BR2-3 TaxID=3048494 RepID=UPI003977729A
MEPILQFRKLSKSISGKLPRSLFTNAESAIFTADTISLLGPSGQGKSTLLRILALLDSPDTGELLLHGKAPSNYGFRSWRKAVTYVSQHSVMLPGSVEDNLKVVSSLHGTIFERELAMKCMTELGLESLDWGKPASELSGGEKQRVALVRSLLLRPNLLLLDEVTASLDKDSKLAAEKLLLDWNKGEGTGFLWITHDLEQAERVSSRCWQLSGGTLSEGATICH